jgi:hypothetical protein
MSLLVAWFFLPSVPDVRGHVPTGDSYDDPEWIQPLLDAGYCVRFEYDPAANRFEKNGMFQATADSYVIGRVEPSPGARALPGSTVTVTIGGSPLGGAQRDWDSVPVKCPD